MAEKFVFEAALKAVQSGQSITGKDGVLDTGDRRETRNAIPATSAQVKAAAKKRQTWVT